MRARSILALTSALAVSALLLAGIAPAAIASAPPGYTAVGTLGDVAAVSSTDAWAVGYLGNADPVPLIVRFDGASWTPQPLPSIAGGGVLYSVAAISARDAWAVGGAGPSGDPRLLVLHWNGHSWRRFSIRKPRRGVLFGVTAVSARDVWAVGQDVAGPTLILHWTGHSWQRADGVNSIFATLQAVTVGSSRNILAVGSAGSRNVIVHYNGHTWSREPSPSPHGGSILYGVTVISGRDAWAVGRYGHGSSPRTIILHWNGRSWRRSHLPASLAGGVFDAVAATPAGQVWAVGQNDTFGTLIAKRNGSSWSPQSCCGVSSGLYGVAAISTGDAWAAGWVSGSGAVDTFLVHWDGSGWSPTS
jgi:hypothetical protein